LLRELLGALRPVRDAFDDVYYDTVFRVNGVFARTHVLSTTNTIQSFRRIVNAFYRKRNRVNNVYEALRSLVMFYGVTNGRMMVCFSGSVHYFMPHAHGAVCRNYAQKRRDTVTFKRLINNYVEPAEDHQDFIDTLI